MALITRKKVPFRVNLSLRKYLIKYGRDHSLPIQYNDLMRFDNTVPLYDKRGIDTLWETVFYPQHEEVQVFDALKNIYAYLKVNGDISVIQHLSIDRVDLCSYGNTMPFRIRIINRVNDNFDYFYIKKADASRVYGLELEHILSPNRISYLVGGETLVEEHIAGITGDVFFQNHLKNPETNIVRLAKEFVKFNERCLVRLLGDMHANNFVVDVTPDFEEVHYRIRAIDFDQQSYEGSKSVYLPQYFKNNNPLIEIGKKYISVESMKQYQYEERVMIAHRLNSDQTRVNDLMSVMARDEISLPANILQLRKELAKHYKRESFLKCQTMGQIVWESLEQVRKF
jgi:hypothetical protein